MGHTEAAWPTPPGGSRTDAVSSRLPSAQQSSAPLRSSSTSRRGIPAILRTQDGTEDTEARWKQYRRVRSFRRRDVVGRNRFKLGAKSLVLGLHRPAATTSVTFGSATVRVTFRITSSSRTGRSTPAHWFTNWGRAQVTTGSRAGGRWRVSHRPCGRLAPQGRLAQLGEHQLDKLGVTGSSPVPPIRKCLQNRGF